MRALLLSLVVCSTAHADSLSGLYDRVAADLRRGQPLVVEAHVALCDNHIIRCGGRGLGDGDSLETNLYWATDGGLRGWFERRGSGWTRVSVPRDGRAGVLETRGYERRVEPGEAWRARGVSKPFVMRVVAHAWRGSKIDDALEAYVADLYGSPAHVVAFLGHDRFMDREPYDFAGVAARGSSPPKGMIMVSCASADYLRKISGDARVPLLLTADLLFAGAHSFDGAIRAFAAAGTYADIRRSAAQSYADGERKPLPRVLTLFTNPADPRWR